MQRTEWQREQERHHGDHHGDDRRGAVTLGGEPASQDEAGRHQREKRQRRSEGVESGSRC
jgi:hypothetical protein